MGQDSYDLSPLIARAKEGDKKAFIVLLVELDYEQVIRAVAREYVSQIPEYEEDHLFRELVIYIWQAFRVSPVRHNTFDQWLRRITRDNCHFIRFKERFIHGDGDAFQPYEHLVRNIIRNRFHKITKHGYEDDVVQDVKFRVWEALPEFRKNAGAFTNFLYKTTKGCCFKIIDKFIARYDSPDLKKSQSTMESNSDSLNSEEIECVRQAIHLLPEEYRKPVVLKEYLDFRHRDIAEILNIPRGTSQVRVQRGKIRLKTILKKSHDN